ncbi:cupin domain-containing protein [Levilactobacillus suantsaii]|uniref:cupin domain-containing protein n=1 Tax=Levilactobacillus suantsaii TaxID=2292255 RepID=UPI002989DECA|nr:cupin domain-containing protein [Levilactobacillus suantsaii]
MEQLNLSPHPEGGWYRQVYKSEDTFNSPGTTKKLHYYTSIYFLLDNQRVSHFHRLTRDELWYFHAGNTLAIHCISPEGRFYSVKLGNNPANNEQFQFDVPAGTIFGSETIKPDSFSLVSCAVAPGFTFDDFELMHKQDLLQKYPDYREIINRLTLD